MFVDSLIQSISFSILFQVLNDYHQIYFYSFLLYLLMIIQKLDYVLEYMM
jgi:hypothetical protein